ncbi:MAG: 4-hydroxy-3-methylbut-2-enyl diphosphate reductase [Alphaproteobacteria bacterium]|nr:4-hydroxy-3-methylbut-2-enyl diphosphate reductase [Alphaproteobacteria bacterium]
MRKVEYLSPRGFCFGVTRAIDMLTKATKEKPYVLHEIVHNDFVVSFFKEQGVIFVENIEDIPNGKTLVISAHGVGKNIYERAKEKGLKIIDTTCPFVKKSHLFVQSLEQKKRPVILIGKKNHAEIIGTIGQLKDTRDVYVVSDINDIETLPFLECAGVATQTTLSQTETNELMKRLSEKIPHLEMQSHVCQASQERQQAVKDACSWADVILVVGDKKSSNANRLVETAKSLGVRSFLISDETELPDLEKSDNIAITSAASTPEEITQRVFQTLKTF